MEEAAAKWPPIGHAIVAGFGLPGRSIADRLTRRGVPFTAVELNLDVVSRCTRAGIHIVGGDARDEHILRSAGLVTTDFVALMIPNDEVMLAALATVRRVRPEVPVLARAVFTSAGMEAGRHGPTDVIITEQVVAAVADERLAKLLGFQTHQ